MTGLSFFQGGWEGEVLPSAQNTPQAKWPLGSIPACGWGHMNHAHHTLLWFPSCPLRTTLLKVQALSQTVLLGIEAALAVTGRGAGQPEPSLAGGLHYVGFTVILLCGQRTKEALGRGQIPSWRGCPCAPSGQSRWVASSQVS